MNLMSDHRMLVASETCYAPTIVRGSGRQQQAQAFS
jgi:hypothetical protein